MITMTITMTIILVSVLLTLFVCLAKTHSTLTGLGAAIRYGKIKMDDIKKEMQQEDRNIKRLETYVDECVANGWSNDKMWRRWATERQYTRKY